MANILLCAESFVLPVCGPQASLRAWPAKRRRKPAGARAGKAGWRRAFLRGFSTGGMRAALSEAGVALGEAVSARAKDPSFRHQIDAIGAERLATAELMLVDLLLDRFWGPDDGKEKSVLALWQAVRDDRRRTAAALEPPVAGGRKPRRAASAERAAAARQSNDRAAELQRLLELTKARLAAAEQAEPASPAAPDQGSSISSSRTRS